jgi:dinuclear metal center YbgI/SA1388 family protein
VLNTPGLVGVGRVTHFKLLQIEAHYRTLRGEFNRAMKEFRAACCVNNPEAFLLFSRITFHFALCRPEPFCFHQPMSKASLAAIVRYCDKLLRVDQIKDYAGAVNGLQVENNGTVTRIAAMVDASLATVRLATAAKADFLLVHHGLFWGASHPWTGKRYQLLRALLDHNLAVYSSHLPLDAHPKLGNNARLCAALGLKRLRPFLPHDGQFIGFQTRARIPRSDLAARLYRATNTNPLVIPGGPAVCRRIGVVTGGAGSELKKAAQEGVDTFITGEGPHWTYALAEELGLNVLYGGHYATETFGVKALGAELSRRFRVPCVFLDHPTGL